MHRVYWAFEAYFILEVVTIWVRIYELSVSPVRLLRYFVVRLCSLFVCCSFVCSIFWLLGESHEFGLITNRNWGAEILLVDSLHVSVNNLLVLWSYFLVLFCNGWFVCWSSFCLTLLILSCSPWSSKMILGLVRFFWSCHV